MTDGVPSRHKADVLFITSFRYMVVERTVQKRTANKTNRIIEFRL